MVITQNDCVYTDSSPSEWSQKFILLNQDTVYPRKDFLCFSFYFLCFWK